MLALFATARQRASRQILRRHRAILRSHARRLPAQPVVGHAPSPRDHVFFRRAAACNDLPLLRDPQGLPAVGRRRPVDHLHARRAGNFLRLDGRASARRGQPHKERSKHHQLLRQRRPGRSRRRQQFRHHISAPEAGFAAQIKRRSADYEMAAAVEQRARAARVPAESAADPDWRAIHAQHVSVDVAEPGYRHALQVRADTRVETAPDFRSARRQQRPASRKSASHRRHRSRQGALARHLRRRDRRRALQRLRFAPDLDHLRAQRRVLGDHGGRAAVPGRSLHSVAALRAIVQRRPGAARHAGQVHALAGPVAG